MQQGYLDLCVNLKLSIDEASLAMQRSEGRSGVEMFAKDGPTLFELICQALTSTSRGYDLLAPKFDLTPFRTADAVLEPSIQAIGPVDSALDLCCGTGAA